MPTNIANIIRAGFERMEYSVLNNSGFAIGNSLTLANGSNAGMGRLLGVNTADISIPDSRIVNAQGDDGVVGQFRFDADAFPSFIVEGSNFDQDLDSLAQQTVKQALGDLTFSGYQPKDPDFTEFSIFCTSQALSNDSGSVGTKGFMTLIFPKVTMQPLGLSGLSNAEVATNRYSVSVNRSDQYPWGLSFTNADNGSTGFVYLYAWSENRITQDSFIGDNSTASFTLRSEVASTTDGGKCQVWVDGTAQTITTDFTLATTSGVTTITFEVGSIPADGAEVGVLYEYVLG